MTEHLRQSIKRTRSNRQSSLKEPFMANSIHSRKNSLIELSVKMQNQQTNKLHSNRKNQIAKRQRMKADRISQHPFSFVSYKKERPQEFKSNQQAHAFVYVNYDIMDLSYSLISSQISNFTLLLLYMILVAIRYCSLFCLVYITTITGVAKWQWIFSIILTYVVYFIAMVKVSLRPAQNKCQTILKLVFDSLQSNEAVEYFQIIQYKKLGQSILRALVPPQFSFLYIWNSSKTKRVEIYCMLNFIYASMEAVIYYPFFVIYTSMYFQQTLGEIPESAYVIVMGLIVIAQAIFLTLTLYLILFGCKKRGYGRNKEGEG